MKEVRFAILMPAYNAQNDIRKALDSIINMEYQNFQVYVINDGSVDDTGKIIKEYEKIDSRIIGLHQDNKGISGAYCYAFNEMNCDYVMFLDSDDSFDDNVLKDVNNVILNEKFDIIQFGISYYDESWVFQKSLTFDESSIYGNNVIIENYLQGLHENKERPNLGIRAYKHSLFQGYKFEVGSLGIDEILTLYAMTKCESISYLPKAYYQCQRRIQSVSRQKATKLKVEGQLKAHDQMISIISKYHEQYLDWIYLKYIQYCISYSHIILREFSCDSRLKKFLNTIKVNKKIKIGFKLNMQINMFLYSPSLLLFINKFKADR